MESSYSFLVNLVTSGSTAKFKTRDGTKWKIEEYWTFLDNLEGEELVDNLAHVIVVKQKNHADFAYGKKLEAYPLEQTEFTTIEKSLSDSWYWFSVTYGEYDKAFRPNGKGSFEKVLFKFTFTRTKQTTDGLQSGTATRRSSAKKRYNYSSLSNIPSSDIKCLTIQTAIGCLLQAIEDDNVEMKHQTIDFIVSNFAELKDTELWREFSVSHRELKDKILDIIIEHMGDQNKRQKASRIVQKTVSQWNVTE